MNENYKEWICSTKSPLTPLLIKKGSKEHILSINKTEDKYIFSKCGRQSSFSFLRTI
jgi:hypothetical protein